MQNLINYIDVGCIGRLERPWTWEHIGLFLGFDPFCKNNSAHKHPINNYAIHSSEGTRPFYIYSKMTCSSLFEINRELMSSHLDTRAKKYKLIDVVDVECKKLSTIINGDFDFLKIDANGGDIEVVMSCDDYIHSIVAIHMEVYHLPLFKNSILFEQTNSIMNDLGFKLRFAMRRENPIFNDYIYINQNTTKTHKRRFIKRLYKKCAYSVNSKTGKVLSTPLDIDNFMLKTAEFRRFYEH